MKMLTMTNGLCEEQIEKCYSGGLEHVGGASIKSSKEFC